MKLTKYIFLAVVLGFVFGNTNAFAQITTEFSDIKIVQENYEEIINLTDAVTVDELAIVKTPIASGTQDLDDGYVRVELGFKFEFNGETYTDVFISVNGFLTFGRMENGRLVEPPLLMTTTRYPNNAFFNDDPSYPVNVIAPFWGNHFYRPENSSFEGYLESNIVYLTRDADTLGNKVFIAEWKDLNINYLLDDEKVKSSVANFQVRIYQSTEKFTRQGHIEFCYGQIAGNSNSTDTRVITTNSVVGIKGYKQAQGTGADYLNGLTYDDDFDPTITTVIVEAAKSKEVTNAWSPSGATNFRIKYISAGRSKVKEWWGDGDVDFSKAPGGRHANYLAHQNRWVTPNDVRVLLNSIVTGETLDATIERAAYHGDVNHNGRYFYNTEGNKVNITWKNEFYDDSLENPITKEISNPKQQIYFEVTEHDAALIMHYMSGRLPELPYMLDTIVQWGKVNAKATGLKIGNITEVSKDVYAIPVFVNGNVNGPLSFKFNVNAEIINIAKNDNYNLTVMSGNNVAVLSGTDDFSSDEAICVINVRATSNEITLSDVRFNDNKHNDITLNTPLEINENSIEVITVTPNPVVNNAFVNVNISTDGEYKLAIFDVVGNKVLDIYNGYMTTGMNVQNINAGTLNAGVYFIKLDGNNTSVTSKLIIK